MFSTSSAKCILNLVSPTLPMSTIFPSTTLESWQPSSQNTKMLNYRKKQVSKFRNPEFIKNYNPLLHTIFLKIRLLEINCSFWNKVTPNINTLLFDFNESLANCNYCLEVNALGLVELNTLSQGSPKQFYWSLPKPKTKQSKSIIRSNNNNFLLGCDKTTIYLTIRSSFWLVRFLWTHIRPI